ncbi:MAG: hypothetical protein H0T64_09295 [Pyrinomonadaceae bacterium]|nr:hypothetical protein [Pyrinomonadaceae bacterium]
MKKHIYTSVMGLLSFGMRRPLERADRKRRRRFGLVLWNSAVVYPKRRRAALAAALQSVAAHA